MTTEIRVPTLGESVTEATIGRWFKQPGDAVAADEPVVELETDKVTVEVPAPASGVLAEILAKDGETVEPGALLGQIQEGGAGAKAPPAAAKAARTFSATWRIWARMSPRPTMLPCASRESWPDTNTMRPPSTTTAWE